MARSKYRPLDKTKARAQEDSTRFNNAENLIKSKNLYKNRSFERFWIRTLNQKSTYATLYFYMFKIISIIFNVSSKINRRLIIVVK